MPRIEYSDGNYRHNIELDEFPRTCPYCGLLVNFEFQATVNYSDSGMEVVFCCPNQECSRLVIATYITVAPDKWVLCETIPSSSESRKFEKFVQDVSPSFCKIWNEAYFAEQNGLSQICGMGYRKALEFLIKDYLINKNANSKEEIVSLLLSSCIEKYITEPRIKDCAKRAAWLGNDETHYNRLWESHDLKDLKTLIDLTVHWIVMEHLTNQYADDMPPKGKKQ